MTKNKGLHPVIVAIILLIVTIAVAVAVSYCYWLAGIAGLFYNEDRGHSYEVLIPIDCPNATHATVFQVIGWWTTVEKVPEIQMARIPENRTFLVHYNSTLDTVDLFYEVHFYEEVKDGQYAELGVNSYRTTVFWQEIKD